MRSHLESGARHQHRRVEAGEGELVQLRSGFGSFSNLAFGYSNALVQANSNLVVQNGRMKDMAASANKGDGTAQRDDGEIQRVDDQVRGVGDQLQCARDPV